MNLAATLRMVNRQSAEELFRTDDARTQCAGTDTAIGWIPHLLINGIACPVRVRVLRFESGANLYCATRTDSQHRPIPLREDGRLVYALPGGRAFVSSGQS